jgi:hypothetical protein
MIRYALVAAAVLAPNSALAFEPESFTNDPSLFGDLAVQDFQSLPPSYWSGIDATDPLVIDDLAYWGDVWADNGWCIPTMDTLPTCGGSNMYLASAVNLHIEPLVPIDRIGFRFASQGPEFYFEIELSDGTTRTFHIEGAFIPEWGMNGPATGFFGYGTGDASLTITHIHLYAADGGIDDIRYGVAATTGICDDLEGAILALGLARGPEQSLLAKAEAADRAIARVNVAASRGVLEALIHALEAQRGKAIPAADADALIDCVEARLTDLEG